MLRFLRIQNVAVVKEVQVEFREGLNVLTGETGAGKSLLVDSIDALMGARIGSESVRTGESTAIVEGVFSVPDDSNIQQHLTLHHLSLDGDELIVRREIPRTGRTRAFVQGVLCPISLLRAIADGLVDIHGQNDRRMLLSPEAHREALDDAVMPPQLRKDLAAAHEAAAAVAASLAEIDDPGAVAKKVDYLSFQLREIKDAHPSQGEDEHLRRQRDLLGDADRIAAMGGEALELLHDSDESVLATYARALKRFVELSKYDEGLARHREALEAIPHQIAEAVETVRRFLQDVETDPVRLDQVQSRLGMLDRLKSKYGPTLANVLEHSRSLEEELAELHKADLRAGKLQEELDRARKTWRERRDQAHELRAGAAARIEQQVVEELKELSLKGVRFDIDVQMLADVQAEQACARHGASRVEFLVSMNPGEAPGPLRRVASGGELSRFMLALANGCRAKRPARIMVFDEIDAGIGGGAAEVVGRKLKKLARSAQVLCVTHLPQIAAFADGHCKVTKHVRKGRTETQVLPLDNEERVGELARMLGGRKITELTRRHAAQMHQLGQRPLS